MKPTPNPPFSPTLPHLPGLACDPATGEVISCKPGAVRLPTRTWRGRTAKALSVSGPGGRAAAGKLPCHLCPVGQLDWHAALLPPASIDNLLISTAPSQCHRQVEILERDHGFRPCTHLEHANYLGRELQRAEFALLTGQQYVQD